MDVVTSCDRPLIKFNALREQISERKWQEGLRSQSHICFNKKNYLDSTLTIADNKVQFAIHRKPTYSDAIISQDSAHPQAYK